MQMSKNPLPNAPPRFAAVFGDLWFVFDSFPFQSCLAQCLLSTAGEVKLWLRSSVTQETIAAVAGPISFTGYQDRERERR